MRRVIAEAATNTVIKAPDLSQRQLRFLSTTQPGRQSRAGRGSESLRRRRGEMNRFSEYQANSSTLPEVSDLFLRAPKLNDKGE
jgi:hypothetical protein